MKVVHVITRFDKGGSAENTFLTVCGLDKNRYDVVLVTGAYPPGKAEAPEVSAIKANVTAAREHQVRLIGLRHLVRDLNLFSDVIAFFSLLNILWREKPHIVHTHTSKAGILGRWAAWFCRVPIIVHTPHGHVFWGYFSHWQTRLFVLLERWTARITTVIVALTPQEKEDHLHFGIAPERKFAVIHSGVDLRMFQANRFPTQEARDALGIPPGTTVVGTVGRLTPVKGQETLIRATADLIRKGEKIFLLLLGDGELQPDLEVLTFGLGMAASVRFLGWRHDVARIMAACDIFCLPSLNEGMGKVLVEAMAMQKPIVASNVGGIPDLVVQGENGILVPPADSKALAEAIMTLHSDQEKIKEMGGRGKLKAYAYSSESMLYKISNLYKTLAGPQEASRKLHTT
jgi:glycosyltransferase involved in cell wall biosynthesis